MKKILGAAAAVALALGIAVTASAPAQAAVKVAPITHTCIAGYKPIYVMSYGNLWKACQSTTNPRKIYLTW